MKRLSLILIAIAVLFGVSLAHTAPTHAATASTQVSLAAAVNAQVSVSTFPPPYTPQPWPPVYHPFTWPPAYTPLTWPPVYHPVTWPPAYTPVTWPLAD